MVLALFVIIILMSVPTIDRTVYLCMVPLQWKDSMCPLNGIYHPF